MSDVNAARQRLFRWTAIPVDPPLDRGFLVLLDPVRAPAHSHSGNGRQRAYDEARHQQGAFLGPFRATIASKITLTVEVR